MNMKKKKWMYKYWRKKMKDKQRTKCEVYSRVVGYLRRVSQWNPGKKQEFKDRTNYKVEEMKKND